MANLRFHAEALDPSRHRREDFDCGVSALNDFLRLRARKEMDMGTLACFVLVPESDPGRIAGFYTLSAATIGRTALPGALTKRLPRYPELPATLLGRLARDVSFRGEGVGDRLLASALHRAVSASQEVASWAIVTDPKDEKTYAFHASFGFLPLTETRQFLPMSTASKWLNVP